MTGPAKLRAMPGYSWMQCFENAKAYDEPISNFEIEVDRDKRDIKDLAKRIEELLASDDVDPERIQNLRTAHDFILNNALPAAEHNLEAMKKNKQLWLEEGQRLCEGKPKKLKPCLTRVANQHDGNT